ncbi:MAG: ATP-dependent metallopeptidase FtsH/Yme1/Tma family protein, partial [Gammaproteobacteria bacterium]
MNDLMKNFVVWALIAVAVLVLFSQFVPRTAPVSEVSYSSFLDEVRNGRVDTVVLQGDIISATRKDKTSFELYNPETENTALIGALDKANVTVVGRAPKQPNFFAQLVLQLAPALLLILVFAWMLRQMQGGGAGGRGAMSFGKSRARLLSEDQVNVTFADVAGVDEAKQEVGEIVD